MKWSKVATDTVRLAEPDFPLSVAVSVLAPAAYAVAVRVVVFTPELKATDVVGYDGAWLAGAGLVDSADQATVLAPLYDVMVAPYWSMAVTVLVKDAPAVGVDVD